MTNPTHGKPPVPASDAEDARELLLKMMLAEAKGVYRPFFPQDHRIIRRALEAMASRDQNKLQDREPFRADDE